MACEQRNIQYNGDKVSFYTDFLVGVQRSRTKFTEVRKRLQHLQATYAMLYLARLCIVVAARPISLILQLQPQTGLTPVKQT